MIGEATTGESSPTGIDGDDFDISSLRGEDFSSGIGDIGEEVNADTDEAAVMRQAVLTWWQWPAVKKDLTPR